MNTKIAFNKIKDQLEDPFFELGHIGKNAIKQRTFPIERYTESPDNFQFIDWAADDERDLVEYSFADTQIGRLLIANTSKGICFLGFANRNDEVVQKDMQHRFPKQSTEERSSAFQKPAVDFCNGNHQLTIPLHLKGTDFQLQIWKKLVRIPEGGLSTYNSLSDNPKAARAVGSAVGKNPVSYIIPCHRVVKNDGNFHGYYWGTEIKRQLLAYELQS